MRSFSRRRLGAQLPQVGVETRRCAAVDRTHSRRALLRRPGQAGGQGQAGRAVFPAAGMAIARRKRGRPTMFIFKRLGDQPARRGSVLLTNQCDKSEFRSGVGRLESPLAVRTFAGTSWQPSGRRDALRSPRRCHNHLRRSGREPHASRCVRFVR